MESKCQCCCSHTHSQSKEKREIYHKEVVGSGIVRCLLSVGYCLSASGVDVVR